MISLRKAAASRLLSFLLCGFELLLLVCTAFRLPFLLRLLRKNLWTGNSHRIRCGRCLHIASIELFKDLPFMLIAVLSAIMAPWRLPALLQAIINQQKRIPSFELPGKKARIPSQRKQISRVFCRIWSHDYLNILMFAVLFGSGYKAKPAFQILRSAIARLRHPDFAVYDFDLRKALFQEVSSFCDDWKTMLYVAIVVIIGFRIKSCFKRLVVRFKRISAIFKF
jgi:hypothetical protein